MRPKVLHFHVIHMKVSSYSRCSRTLSMNVVIKSAHYDSERNLFKDCVWSKIFGKHNQM